MRFPMQQAKPQVNPIEAIAMLLQQQAEGGGQSPQQDPANGLPQYQGQPQGGIPFDHPATQQMPEAQQQPSQGKIPNPYGMMPGGWRFEGPATTTPPQGRPPSTDPADMSAMDELQKRRALQDALSKKFPFGKADIDGNPDFAKLFGQIETAPKDGLMGVAGELSRKSSSGFLAPYSMFRNTSDADKDITKAMAALRGGEADAPPGEATVTAPASGLDASEMFKPPPEDVQQPAEENSDTGKEFSAHMKEAAQAARAKGRLNTPEQADNFFRSEFKDDPYIEDALQQAHQRYEAAKAESGKNPGILEYIGFALMSLAGANPFQAAEVISRRGEKFSREQGALNDLMQMQGTKIGDRRYRTSLQTNERMNKLDAGAMLEREDMRGEQKDYQQNVQALQSARNASQTELRRLTQAQGMEMSPEGKKKWESQIQKERERLQYFRKMLGEPTGDPVSRLLGIDGGDAA